MKIDVKKIKWAVVSPMIENAYFSTREDARKYNAKQKYAGKIKKCV